MSLESLWERLEEADAIGVFQRIEEDHSSDFYAAIDAQGRRGLILIASQQMPVVADLENLEMDSVQQQDGRWRTSIWVNHKELQTLFTSLVKDIVGASRSLPPDAVPKFTASRIARWKDLLEDSREGFALWQLRGLIAELEVMKRLFRLKQPPEVVEAWTGPFGSPQDFVFEGQRIEAKAIGPTARRVRITSADQLDVPENVQLRLVTVALASVAAESDDGFNASDSVSEIRAILADTPQANEEFSRRLFASGVGDINLYDHVRMRVDAIRCFAVTTQFPRIARGMLASGVEEVSYSLVLSDIADYEVAFGE